MAHYIVQQKAYDEFPTTDPALLVPMNKAAKTRHGNSPSVFVAPYKASSVGTSYGEPYTIPYQPPAFVELGSSYRPASATPYQAPTYIDQGNINGFPTSQYCSSIGHKEDREITRQPVLRKRKLPELQDPRALPASTPLPPVPKRVLSQIEEQQICEDKIECSNYERKRLQVDGHTNVGLLQYPARSCEQLCWILGIRVIRLKMGRCRRIAFRGWRQGCCQPPECRPATSEGIEKANIKRGATYTS